MEGERLGVRFVRCSCFPTEFLADVIDMGEAGFRFQRPVFVSAIPIDGDTKKMRVEFHPLLNPFAHKSEAERGYIDIPWREVFHYKANEGIEQSYLQATSPIVRPPSLDLSAVK